MCMATCIKAVTCDGGPVVQSKDASVACSGHGQDDTVLILKGMKQCILRLTTVLKTSAVSSF